jgi:hypothetical protein
MGRFGYRRAGYCDAHGSRRSDRQRQPARCKAVIFFSSAPRPWCISLCFVLRDNHPISRRLPERVRDLRRPHTTHTRGRARSCVIAGIQYFEPPPSIYGGHDIVSSCRHSGSFLLIHADCSNQGHARNGMVRKLTHPLRNRHMPVGISCTGTLYRSGRVRTSGRRTVHRICCTAEGLV